MNKKTILCLDDEIDNVEALERLLRKKYNVLKATQASEALKLLDQNREICLIISDQRMPEMTGVEFLQKSIEVIPDAIRILLTGYTDVESIIQAVNQGQIYRYLTKPWDPNDLIQTIDQAVERFELGQLLIEKNRELEKAYLELKTLDQSKSHFMILINHELKTPLTTILSFLDLLKETHLDEDQKKYVQRIAKSSTRLREIIEDVLLVMRAEMGQFKIEKQILVLKDLAQALDPTVLAEAAKKEIQIQFKIEDMTLSTDRRLILQVINRLMHNAIKFGYAQTNLIFEIHRASAYMTSFSIYNEGPHIKPEIIHKILKPFQLDENIMNHSTGMGLGLTVSQSILQSMGSELNIENKDKGVLVSFHLS